MQGALRAHAALHNEGEFQVGASSNWSGSVTRSWHSVGSWLVLVEILLKASNFVRSQVNFFANLWPLGSSPVMFCGKCRRSLFSKRSTLCIACAAAATLTEEFQGEWGNETLRFLAGDVAVSAARHVRALRVASNKPVGATPKSAGGKPPFGEGQELPEGSSGYKGREKCS